MCVQASVGPPAPARSHDVHSRPMGAGGGGCEPCAHGPPLPIASEATHKLHGLSSEVICADKTNTN